MQRAPAPPLTDRTYGRQHACALVLTVLGLLSGGARAELLGTHPHRDGTVQLMTDLCRVDDPGAGQRARQTVGGRERQGCWGVDNAGNPVVTWGDGTELELDDAKVRLSRRMAGLLERAEASRPHARAEAPARTDGAGSQPARPAAVAPPSPRRTQERNFARPAWCPDAGFPHERLVCSDAELAARDLRLASLWWPYRRTLSRAGEAWHKSDYFRRLKVCGADRSCIVSEQETQMRRYREAPPAGG